MDKKKKKALKYTAKKLFRPTVVSIVFLVIAIGAACASAFLGEVPGHEDYVISTIFLSLATGMGMAAVCFGGSNDIFYCRAVRTSPLYKEVRLFALPLIATISAVVLVVVFSVLSVVTSSAGFIVAERIPDSMIACAVGAGLALLGGGHPSFTIVIPFCFFSVFSIASIFAPRFLINGFGADVITAILISATILVLTSIIGFFVTRIAYRKRNTQYIDSVAKAYANTQLQ